MTMRLLHTADWHVGRTLRGRSRADEHAATLERIVAVADEQSVDLVIVAGDLFDTAAPSPDAERLVYTTLLRLAERGRRVVVVSGNHDHPRRLAAVEPLLELAGVDVRPFLVAPAEGGVVDLELRGTPVRLALMPWLSQRHAVSADDLLARDADQHNQTYTDRMRRIAAALCHGFDGGRVNLVAAHLTAVGATMGGGERQAHTIFDYAVPASIFPPSAGYVALGHLHRMQRVDGPAPTYYCGSPLQLDFGEGDNTPGVMLVELDVGRPARVEQIAIDAAPALRTLTGSLAELDLLVPATGMAHLRLIVREARRAGLADDVRERFPRAVDIRIEPPEGSGGAAGTTPSGDRLGRTPAELFREYLEQASVRDERVTALFDRLVSEDTDAQRDRGEGHAA